MKAIDLVPEDKFIDEWCGFTVYDAVTGDPVDYDFLLNTDGKLCCMTNVGVIEIEKGDYFIIQFATGEYMRW